MSGFKKKHFLIVGATGNLGGSIARLLKDEGAALTLTGRDSQKLAQLEAELSVPVQPFDLQKTENIKALVESIGNLDGIVDAAGVAPLAPLKYIKDDDFEHCLSMNVQRPTLLLRDLVKAGKLNEGASIVWISSIASSLSTPGYAMYAASKAALEAAARCLAHELVSSSVRLNCIAPGMIESDMAEEAAKKISKEAMERHIKSYPLGAGRVADVAEATGFLLSERARWITGSVLTLDGGYGLTKG